MDCPATASGVLRGRVSNSLLRRATEAEEAAKLRQLIDAERCDEAEDYAAEVIAEYTDLVAKWTTVPSIEAYLRDCAFNRGPGGAAKILQIALGVQVGGGVGPETLGARLKHSRETFPNSGPLPNWKFGTEHLSRDKSTANLQIDKCWF